MLISRPGPNRQNEPLSVDVDEARILQPVVKLWACAGFHALRAGALDEFLIELLDFAAFEATVRARPLEVEVDKFGVAARLGIAADVSNRYSKTFGEVWKRTRSSVYLDEPSLGLRHPCNDSGYSQMAFDESNRLRRRQLRSVRLVAPLDGY